MAKKSPSQDVKPVTNLPAVIGDGKKEDFKNQALSLLPIVNALRLYHRHEVVGMENIPKDSQCLLVVNHSLATYDIGLLFAAVYEKTGRLTRPLIDRLFFRVPFLGDVMSFFGSVQGTPDNAKDLLYSGNIVAVAPGGMQEALRPSTERYQIRWDRRYGFARLAIETGTPIVLAACPKADDIYDVYPSPITKWAYQAFKIPVFIARGFGLTPLPRPVKLVHHLSEPMIPPKPLDNPEAFKRQVQRFHAKICKRMEMLIGEAIATQKT